MSFSIALPPWLREAVEEAGDATVILKAGDRPYVIKSKAPYHLGTQPLTKLALEALAQQILSEDAQNALYNGENVQETLSDGHAPVTVRAVRLDHEIVIRLRHEPVADRPDPVAEPGAQPATAGPADELAPGPEEGSDKFDGAINTAGDARAAAPGETPGTPEPTPADAPPASPPFAIQNAGDAAVVENAGRDAVQEIELPTSAEAVDTFISALSPAHPAPATLDGAVPTGTPLTSSSAVEVEHSAESFPRPDLYSSQGPRPPAPDLSQEASFAERHQHADRQFDEYVGEQHDAYVPEQCDTDPAGQRDPLGSETLVARQHEPGIAEQPEAYSGPRGEGWFSAQRERHAAAQQEQFPAMREPQESQQPEDPVARQLDAFFAGQREPYVAEQREAYAMKRDPYISASPDAHVELQRDIFFAAQRDPYVTAQHEAYATPRRDPYIAGSREELFPHETPQAAADESAMRGTQASSSYVAEPGGHIAGQIGERISKGREARTTARPKAYVAAPSRPSVLVVATAELGDWINEAMDRGATALYLRAGSAPAARIDGRVEVLASEPLPMAMFERAGSVMTTGKDGWRGAGEWAWSRDIPGAGTVRCQAFSDSQGGGLIVRLPVPVSDLDQHVPRHIRLACEAGEGLIVVSSPFFEDVTAMVGAVVASSARRRAGFVVAFGFDSGLQSVAREAFVSARPLPSSREEMVMALQSALHERPDTLVVLADGDLAAADAIAAAAVGRLVIVGIVARTAPRALEVLLKNMAGERRTLASVFRGACSWRGFRRPNAPRVVVSDALVGSGHVCALVESGDIAALHQAQVSGQDGMRTFDMALAAAVTRRKISLREAAACAVDRKSLVALVRRRAREGCAASCEGQDASQHAEVRRALPGA